MERNISEEEVFDISSGSFLERFIAWLVDQAVLLAPLILFISWSSASVEMTPESVRMASQEMLQIYVLTNVAYFTFFEGSFGWSPGKKLMNLRVYNETGNQVGYMFALLRRVGLVVPLFLFVDAASVLISSKKQRIFDIVAGTLVIKEKQKSLALKFLRGEEISDLSEEFPS